MSIVLFSTSLIFFDIVAVNLTAEIVYSFLPFIFTTVFAFIVNRAYKSGILARFGIILQDCVKVAALFCVIGQDDRLERITTCANYR
jgi:hypothetical protein